MSYEYMTPIIRHPSLSPCEKLVLFAIAEHINPKTKIGWPSYDTIADLAGCKRRWAIRVVASLEKRGILKITKRRLADRQGSNIYQIIGLTTQSALKTLSPSLSMFPATVQGVLDTTEIVAYTPPESARESNKGISDEDFSARESIRIVMEQRQRIKQGATP